MELTEPKFIRVDIGGPRVVSRWAGAGGVVGGRSSRPGAAHHAVVLDPARQVQPDALRLPNRWSQHCFACRRRASIASVGGLAEVSPVYPPITGDDCRRS